MRPWLFGVMRGFMVANCNWATYWDKLRELRICVRLGLSSDASWNNLLRQLPA